MYRFTVRKLAARFASWARMSVADVVAESGDLVHEPDPEGHAVHELRSGGPRRGPRKGG